MRDTIMIRVACGFVVVALAFGIGWAPIANGQEIAPDEAWCVRGVDNAMVCREAGRRYATADNNGFRPRTATDLFEAACDGGDATGCAFATIDLEAMRRLTTSGERNREFAVASCDLGYAEDCTAAGNSYRRAMWDNENHARAAELFLAGCAGGDAYGCVRAGNHYLLGLGVNRDEARAAEFFSAGCTGGDMEGCMDAGRVYGAEGGVAEDQPRATTHYLAACEAGNAVGCFEVGRRYATGTSVAEDRIQSRSYFETTCWLLAAVQYQEGLRFVTRWGVDQGINLVRACEAGFDQAYLPSEH